MYINFNENPQGKQVGDCVIRALSIALDKNWDEIYIKLCLQGFLMCDMPSANHVWGSYLRENGFKRYLIPSDIIDFYTVEDFCKDNSRGVYILALSNHVVTTIDGNYYDLWDSGEEIVNYYWRKED